MMVNLKSMVLGVVAAGTATLALGQSTTTLTVGDPAPQLKVSTWIKGTPTQSFDRDKMYVVEFWATWCGPCRQMMPHLSEMAKKYAGKVSFDSFDVWENAHSETPASPTETLAKVKEFVADMGDKMSYNIAADTSDGYMAKNWLAAASQPGIPAAFLIKGGQIIWIGHPYYMEKTIDQVLAGTYDQAAFAKEYRQKMQVSQDRDAKWKAVLDPITKAMANKDYPTAIEKIDAGVKAVPDLKFSLYVDKFKALLAMDPTKALAFAKEMHNDSLDMATYALEQCADKDGLSADFYRLGLSYELESISAAKKPSPFACDTLAKFYFKLGDGANAVASEEKAIDLANKAVQDRDSTLVASDFKGMQGRLDQYRAAQKRPL